MSIKIKVSYERPEELQEVMERLKPMLRYAKVKSKEGRFKRAYLELETGQNVNKC